ncbi:hypothetical protein SEUCBS139899_008252 [Sporothrix eucalyptigena]
MPLSATDTASAGAPVASREDYYRVRPTVVMPTVSQVALPSFSDKHEARVYWKHRLALAFRIFAQCGFENGVAGHITLRDPVEPSSFWVNPFGKAWRSITVDDLIRVGSNGKVVEGGPNRLLNAAAYSIHHAVHAARPDIACVAHSHSIYGKAFSALGCNLDMITQDACAFHDDIAFYTSKGIVLDSAEGAAIAAALGSRKAAILQNHGLLTCGTTVDSCVFWYLALEKSCQAQLLADAAAAGRGGATVKMDTVDAAYTYKTVGTEMAGWFSAKPLFETAEEDASNE